MKSTINNFAQNGGNILLYPDRYYATPNIEKLIATYKFCARELFEHHEIQDWARLETKEKKENMHPIGNNCFLLNSLHFRAKSNPNFTRLPCQSMTLCQIRIQNGEEIMIQIITTWDNYLVMMLSSEYKMFFSGKNIF